ncbi:NUDIX domain-containing protein [Candidatus Parcubacteria bacterium]|nr:NUDIX domain-containing protein [Candidatus Parcubacteria bacterium]
MHTGVPYFEDEDSKQKPGVRVVERNNINAIVYNKETDEVLCLDWQKFGWKTFIIGGVEGDEDPVEAAKREILEETGYKNLKLISHLGKTRSGYYAAHKGENRISNATGLLFELENDEREVVPDAENLPHIFIWLPQSKVSSFITPSSQKYYWQKAQEYLTSQTI